MQNNFDGKALVNTGGATYAYAGWMSPYPAAIVGPQLVRIVAESALSGLRHATQVEFEPFSITAPAQQDNRAFPHE